MPFDDETFFDDALFYQKRKHGSYRQLELPVRPHVATDTHLHAHLTAHPVHQLAKAMVWNVQFMANVVDIAEDGEEPLLQINGWMGEALALARTYAPAVGVDVADVRMADMRLIVGVHPHNARLYTDELERRLLALAQDARVCAFGEAGLDFYYNHSSQEDQVAMFKRHIRIAKEANLPLCLHIRDAHDLALDILEHEGFPQAGCVLHCFNLDKEVLKPWLEHDVYVGFDGPLTFKKSDDVRSAAAIVPLDRLLTETDAPYMTPEPMRGMECGPAHVIYTLAELERVRGIEGDAERRAFEVQLHQNACRIYGARSRCDEAPEA